MRPTIITSMTTSCWDVGALVYNYVISTVELPIVQTFQSIPGQKTLQQQQQQQNVKMFNKMKRKEGDKCYILELLCSAA